MNKELMTLSSTLTWFTNKEISREYLQLLQLELVLPQCSSPWHGAGSKEGCIKMLRNVLEVNE